MTHAMDKASRRAIDTNGWFEVKGNPLSKVGIFDYSGAQIGAPADQADKIFRVYRPAEELGSAETIESFKLVPFIDNHTMLGEGFTPTDERPIAGVVGEDIYFEGDTLYGNPKVYSKALADKIKTGKTELSLGYRCRYDFTPGVFNGETFDVVQRSIRGNHLALVDEGRMGPEVSILDQLTITVDAKEISPVEEKLAEILAAIQALSGRVEALEAAKPSGDEETDVEVIEDEEIKEEVIEDEEVVVAQADPEEVEAKAEEVAELADDLAEIAAEISEASGMDAKIRGRVAKIADKAKAISAKAAMDAKGKPKARPAMDEASVMAAIARKTGLVDKLSKHIGTFDHAGMTAQKVAEYGVAKLGIRGVRKGQEIVALDAFLQAKPVSTPVATAQDKAPSVLSKRIAAHATGE